MYQSVLVVTVLTPSPSSTTLAHPQPHMTLLCPHSCFTFAYPHPNMTRLTPIYPLPLLTPTHTWLNSSHFTTPCHPHPRSNSTKHTMHPASSHTQLLLHTSLHSSTGQALDYQNKHVTCHPNITLFTYQLTSSACPNICHAFSMIHIYSKTSHTATISTVFSTITIMIFLKEFNIDTVNECKTKPLLD